MQKNCTQIAIRAGKAVVGFLALGAYEMAMKLQQAERGKRVEVQPGRAAYSAAWSAVTYALLAATETGAKAEENSLTAVYDAARTLVANHAHTQARELVVDIFNALDIPFSEGDYLSDMLDRLNPLTTSWAATHGA
jgi:hypothetical protein